MGVIETQGTTEERREENIGSNAMLTASEITSTGKHKNIVAKMLLSRVELDMLLLSDATVS